MNDMPKANTFRKKLKFLLVVNEHNFVKCRQYTVDTIVE